MPTEDKEARFLQCIGEPTRLRIMKLLAGGERCVGDIVSALGREQSLVSHHLRALKDCNVVITRQEAQKVYYHLASPELAEIVLKSESLVTRLSLCQNGRCGE
ncbi:MAG: winged helix-turn-helix transcriptional regulator [Chloroflexi bacterium]|nr:winged helix-turn-helix transcriptional regulator [Chloroflexota bacterium]